MTQANAEIIRRAFDAFNRGDLDAALENLAPDFEYVPSGAIPGVTHTFHGPAGYRSFLRWILDEFDDVQAELDEIRGEADHVFTSVTLRGAESRVVPRRRGPSGRSSLSATAWPSGAERSGRGRRPWRPRGWRSSGPWPLRGRLVDMEAKRELPATGTTELY